MKQDSVTFPSEGLTLEGVLHWPDGQGPFPAVVVCHPHPLYGGSMSNSVVVHVCRALAEGGIGALRFNFRGVGRSQGKLEGAGMSGDVTAALDYLSSLEEVDGGRLGVCGYSAGAIAAFSSTPLDGRLQAAAAISPPLSMATFEGLLEWERPKLVLVGSMDGFIDHLDLEVFVNSLAEPVRCDIVESADHFWWGFERQIGGKVAAFFLETLTGSRRV